MLDKLQKILLIGLFFILPIINSHLFDLLWIKWWFYVDWNYEYTKVILFNILSGIILTLFFIKSLFSKNKLLIPTIIFPLIIILFASTLSSDYIFPTIIWNTSKWHSLIMFLNLILFFILFLNQTKKFKKKLIFTTIISSLFVWILWIKEYYLPSFDYWDLQNRALSTFWHPNYLALYILILIPFLIKKVTKFYINKKINIKNILYSIIFIILVFLLFLTKSAWWILIFLLYILYIIYSKNKKKINKKYLSILIIFIIFILWIIIYNFWLLTKLNSFISRFYIWETTLKIIFAEAKNIIFGSWVATLDFVFDSYKVPELYIFENIGFTADRPHNLILNFFYNFWIWWLIFIIYSLYKLIKKYKNSIYFHAIILFLIFTIFNFASISHYLIIILIISIIYKNKSNYKNNIINFIKNFLSFILITILLIISIYWSYISYYNYKSEYFKYNKTSYIEKHFLIDWRENETGKYIWKHITWASEYLYYWDLYREYWNKKEAILNYNKWLELLPDMWNKNSKYYDNYFIQKLFVSERFYSEKFSNLNEILKRVWKKEDF